MPTMEFTTETLEQIIAGKHEDYVLKESPVFEEVRWGYRYRPVFLDVKNQKFYAFTYEVGAGDSVYDFEPSQPVEVKPHIKTSIVYKEIDGTTD